MTKSPVNEPNPKHSTFAALILIVIGAVCTILSILNITPLAVAARAVSPDGMISDTFANILNRQQFFFGIAFIAGGIAAVAFPLYARRLSEFFTARHTSDRSLPILCLLGGLLCLFIQHSLFSNMPHVTDATCHNFQGKVFANGMLAADLPPCPNAFYQHNMVMTSDGKWFARYPPGTAMLLAAGNIIGMPWLPMPLVHALSIAAFFFLTSRFFARSTAYIATFLYTLSPLTLLLGSSFMSHTPFMAAAMAGLAMFFNPDVSKRRIFFAGCIFGSTILIRPQDTAIVVIATGICALFSRPSAWPPLIKKLPMAIAGGCVPLMLFLSYNFAQYGTLLTTGYGFDNDAALQTGISVSMGFSETYTPADAVRNTLNILYKFNGALFGWPISILFLAVLIIPSFWSRHVAACLGGIGFIAAFFFFYSYPAYEFEARFWILLTPMCIALTAEVIRKLASIRRFAPVTAGIIFAMFTFAALDYWPHHIWPTYSTDYEQAGPGLEQRVDELETPALVLINTDRPHNFRYTTGFAFNDPKLQRPVIYARDGDADRRNCLAEAFPERSVYAYAPGIPWDRGSFIRVD